MMIQEAQQSGAHSIERGLPVHRLQIPDRDDEMIPVFEIIRAGFARFETIYDRLDLSFRPVAIHHKTPFQNKNRGGSKFDPPR
jgi:hypothetical protein